MMDRFWTDDPWDSDIRSVMDEDQVGVEGVEAGLGEASYVAEEIEDDDEGLDDAEEW